MTNRVARLAFVILLCGVASIAHAQRLSLTDEQLGLLRQHLGTIETVNPSAPVDDLAFLYEFVGDARVVALGEATHGNLEFSQMKHRIIQYLIEEMGFGVVAFEVNMPEARRLDRYVTMDVEDADAFASTMYSVWHTDEVHALVEWIRSHNATAPGTVNFVGFDMQSPVVAVPNVMRFLERVDPDFVDEAAEHYEVALASRDAEDPADYFEQMAPEWRRGANAVLDRMLEHGDEYRKMLPPDEVEVAIQDARIVLQAALMMYYEPTRDASMAQNLLWLLDRHPNQKFVLWAHNGHVAEAQLVYSGDPDRMGWHLANALGDDYISLGFILGRGAYHGRDRNTNEFVISELPHIAPSVGGQLSRLEEPLFFLSLRELAENDELHPLIGGTVLARSFGRLAAASTGLKLIRLSEAFDAIIYIDEVGPSHRIP